MSAHHHPRTYSRRDRIRRRRLRFGLALADSLTDRQIVQRLYRKSGRVAYAPASVRCLDHFINGAGAADTARPTTQGV